MAENCIFCGKALSFFTRASLACGGADQPVCSDCAEKYGKEPVIQRARLALDTGRAKEPERLTEFIEAEKKRLGEAENRKKARAELLQRAREGRRESIRCCGFDMVRDGEYTFADQTPFALRMFPVYTPTLVMFRCEVCGQVKLFDASFFPPEEGGTEPEWEPKPPEEQVTCPVCGTRHGASMGCPTCALLSARSGRRPQPAEAAQPETKPFKPSRSRPGQKPPWEK